MINVCQNWHFETKEEILYSTFFRAQEKPVLIDLLFDRAVNSIKVRYLDLQHINENLNNIFLNCKCIPIFKFSKSNYYCKGDQACLLNSKGQKNG